MPQEHHQAVTPAEAGQKLVQYLARRLGVPHSVLHRWIRTGQVRVNGGRRKPFDRVEAGDTVRLPPFARQENTHTFASPDTVPVITGVPILYADSELIICHKPAGLPVHGGTGHSDSLTARLTKAFANAPFAPTPAHRLDKDTSGLICIALSYTRLRALHEALRTGRCVKDYLAWVEGDWPHDGTRLFTHNLTKRYTGTDEKMRLADTGPRIKEARCTATCLERCHGRSLLHLCLLTGRTHQLRAQCALLGHPVCGDKKYGAHTSTPLRLHATRLILPEGLGPDNITCLPDWDGDFYVSLPMLS